MYMYVSQSTSNYLVVVNNTFKLPYPIDSNDIRSIYEFREKWKKKLHEEEEEEEVCTMKNTADESERERDCLCMCGLQRKQPTKNAHMAKDYSTSTVLYT